jgi:hypothetical protein
MTEEQQGYDNPERDRPQYPDEQQGQQEGQPEGQEQPQTPVAPSAGVQQAPGVGPDEFQPREGEAPDANESGDDLPPDLEQYVTNDPAEVGEEQVDQEG